MKLEGNTLLITGGATGIGLGMARAFLERGNRVTVCGRRIEELEQARRQLPGLVALCCDIRDPRQRQSLREELKREGLRPNVLVNNAARMRAYSLDALSEADTEALRADLETNLLAPIELTRLLLPDLLAVPQPTLINLNSPGGVVPVAQLPIYCASKAALHSYTLSLRHQLAGRLKVIEIYPPSVDTQMMQGVDLPSIGVDAFTSRLMPKLARGLEEIWVGQARILRLMQRLAPGWTLALVNRSTSLR